MNNISKLLLKLKNKYELTYLCVEIINSMSVASNHKFRPESLMMSYGYKPELSEGAIKCPIFQTSTFVFKNAEEGKAFFEVAYGIREKQFNEELGLIYSRLNNPDLEILENRLCLWDQADECAVFESGMSAITTVLLEFLEPGDLMIYSTPLYGGTDHFIHTFLNKINVKAIGIDPDMDQDQIKNTIATEGEGRRLKMIYLETPANPTNSIYDIEMMVNLGENFSDENHKVFVAVDNTYMGPLWQHPLSHGADFVIYSATKYIGGHSDVIAGAVLSNHDLMKRVKSLRTFLGNMASPNTGWLLLRSLETLKVRMQQQATNAAHVAQFLAQHSMVQKVHFLGFIDPSHKDFATYTRQYSSAGAMISFELRGGEKEAFRFLNGLKMIKLAVSLGSTESLAEHPATMTHAGIDENQKIKMGITPNLIRISVGIEHHEDIIWDIAQALDGVPKQA